jgi:hypothetical protein
MVKTDDKKLLDKQDPRRLIAHRKRNCEYWKCWRELAKLPPMETAKGRVVSYKFQERAVKKAKKEAKKQVKLGKQHSITSFLKRSRSCETGSQVNVYFRSQDASHMHCWYTGESVPVDQAYMIPIFKRLLCPTTGL